MSKTQYLRETAPGLEVEYQKVQEECLSHAFWTFMKYFVLTSLHSLPLNSLTNSEGYIGSAHPNTLQIQLTLG